MIDPSLSFVGVLGLALGAAWVSGVRLYGCVAALGWLSYFHLVNLPGSMASIANPIVTYVATALFVVEFFADKIPWLDTGWHTVHAFVAIPAGAILASSAFAHYQPGVVAVAFLLGGTVAATSHGSKTATRAVLNLSPEPVTNIAASLWGDLTAPVILAASVLLPVLGIVLVLCLMVPAVLVIRKALLMRAKRLREAASQPEQA